MEWLEKNELSSNTYVCPENENGNDRWCTIDEGGLDVLIAAENVEENAWVNMEENMEENREQNGWENAGMNAGVNAGVAVADDGGLAEEGWHLLMDDGQVVGPYVMNDLIQWYYDGAVDGNVQVHGGHDWMLLSEAVLLAEEEDSDEEVGEEVGESEVYLLDGITNETNGEKIFIFLFFHLFIY